MVVIKIKVRTKHLIILLFLLLFVISMLSVISHISKLHLKGSGTKTDPYLIESPEQFTRLGDSKFAYYRIEKDLDFSKVKFRPIRYFNGILDGNGKSLLNINIDGTKQFKTAIFLELGKDSKIINLKIENIDILSGLEGAILVHTNNGVIENVTISGNAIINPPVGTYSSLSSDIMDIAVPNYNEEGKDISFSRSSEAKYFNINLIGFAGISFINRGEILNSEFKGKILYSQRAKNSGFILIASGINLYNSREGIIYNSNFEGELNFEVERSLIGGISVYNRGKIQNSGFKGKISVEASDSKNSIYGNYIGGIVYHNGGVTENCKFTGELLGDVVSMVVYNENGALIDTMDAHNLGVTSRIFSSFSIQNYGKILSSKLEGIISANRFGGFVFNNYSSGERVFNCQVDASVTANEIGQIAYFTSEYSLVKLSKIFIRCSNRVVKSFPFIYFGTKSFPDLDKHETGNIMSYNLIETDIKMLKNE
ncbi:hypothetical protein MNL76_10065 [Fervidobacterium riparium]|nr:hypothetical protein IB67_02490 [Fervidobacterium riparium]